MLYWLNYSTFCVFSVSWKVEFSRDAICLSASCDLRLPFYAFMRTYTYGGRRIRVRDVHVHYLVSGARRPHGPDRDCDKIRYKMAAPNQLHVELGKRCSTRWTSYRWTIILLGRNAFARIPLKLWCIKWEVKGGSKWRKYMNTCMPLCVYLTFGKLIGTCPQDPLKRSCQDNYKAWPLLHILTLLLIHENPFHLNLGSHRRSIAS